MTYDIEGTKGLKLNIRSETMIGGTHSWAITMRNLLWQFYLLQHKLYLKSTTGQEFVPKELISRLNREIAIPDIDICYTLPSNFQQRFAKKSKIKAAIYNYESSILPPKWKSNINQIDYLLPSSNFSKQIFLEAGCQEDKCKVIPHGINITEFENKNLYPLQTKKQFRFLNISIPHYRKNIQQLVETYYQSFSDQDDVCLVLKTSLEKPKQRFEVDVGVTIKALQERYKNRPGGLPQIELITQKIENMIPLYNSCHVILNAASSEGFGLPMLEGLAADKVIIAPRCSGQLDFLTDNNSILIDVKEIDATPQYQYWIASNSAKTYLPNFEMIGYAMKNVYLKYEFYQNMFKEDRQKTVEIFSWENAAKKILELA